LVEDLSDRSKTVAGQLDDAEQAGRKLQAKMAECRKKIDEKDAATEGAQNSLNNLKRAAKEYKGKIIKEEVKLEQALAAKKPQVDSTLEAQEKVRWT
jgi:ABC-type transporter Mla subunit MlaD